MHKTFTFDACRDGNLYGEEFIAGTREEAERQAVAALNDDWHENYASYEDMAEDMDGCAIIEHPAIMAPRLPQDTIDRYRRLAVGLRDMIDGQRIDATMLPDDFLWLSLALDDLAMIDPSGDPADVITIPNAPPRVVINITGGIMQGATADQPVDVYCIDYDNYDDDRAIPILQDDGSTADATVSEQAADVDTSFVEMVVALLDACEEDGATGDDA